MDLKMVYIPDLICLPTIKTGNNVLEKMKLKTKRGTVV
ncbi:MAG: hypothetical protein ACI9WL_001321 [Rubritalea sp.]|jgi:hypothetical protein